MPASLHVVGAAILRDGRCLAARRSARMSSPLRWEFPGGKVERGEGPRAALVRELREELGIEVRVDERLGRGHGEVAGGRALHLDLYAAEILAGEPTAHEHAELAWLAASELAQIDWAEPDEPLVALVKARLERSRADSSPR